jgi:5S rRNA maturation endonuclease (ribonuclease M5)
MWWETPNGEKGLGGVRVTELPLYGVDRLRNATFAVVVEGEKACEALQRLGLPAVGTVTGASTIPCDDSLKPLLGRTVYLWADNDSAGRAHMEGIARRLYALGHEDIRWVTWSEAPPGGDAADLVASGATHGEVERLLQRAEVWRPPEAPDGASLLCDLENYFTRYLVLPPGAPIALAAWTMATWVVDAFEVAPYLSVTSAEKRCGKTTLLDLLSYVVREPLATANISEAALFRAVEARRPTLLIDEGQQLRERTERAAALHDLLAAGHTRGRPVYRVAKTGEGFRLETHEAFGFKAIALVGEISDILADRSISIRMSRRKPGEKVERFRRLRIKAETEPLRQRLEAWAIANEARVREAYLRVEPPAWMNDRAADNWAVLWAVVQVAAPDRLPDLEASARALEGDDSDLGRESLGVRLLSDLRRVFEERQSEWLRTEVVLEDLRADPEAPWGGWRGRGLTAEALARILRRYGIRSEQRRVGERVVRGYSRAALLDVWERYLPQSPAPNLLHLLQARQDAASSPKINPLQDRGVAGSKNGPDPHNDGPVAGVAGSAPQDAPSVDQYEEGVL